MYAATIRVIADREELKDLDTFVEKSSKAHKGTFLARGYSNREKIREYVRDFYRKSSARAWVRDIKGFVSDDTSDVKVKSASIRKIPK